MNGPARILLVDDSVVVRGLLSRTIDAESDLEVLSTAPNGRIGVEKVRSLEPDLVVLDVEMPEMNGLEALQEIRKTHPDLPIIMFSTLTGDGASVTVEALAKGASDYATKPTNTGNVMEAMKHVEAELISKIRTLVKARRPRRSSASNPVRTTTRRGNAAGVTAVVVGSSTGGPVALEQMLSRIDVALSVPMFIVQHMPETFTRALAERLDRKTVHHVVEAEQGMTAEPGTVYIAPGGKQMSLRSFGNHVTIRVTDDPPVNSCKPSVEPLFETAADIYGRNTLAVMLTGMGSDGTDGTRRLADLGCDVFAQDEATSVVWGMPGSVVDNGLATKVLPIDRVGPEIASRVAGRSLAGSSRTGVTT